jgi:capsular polysaccharide transport system permease protein
VAGLDGTRQSLARSFALQRRVIGALLMRELITRFGRQNIGVLWLLGEPAIFTLGVAALWSAAGLGHSTMPIIAFAVTGYSSVLMWRNSVNRCSDAVKSNVNLLFHRNVKLIDLFAARVLLEMAGATGSFIVLSIVFVSMEWMEPPVDAMRVVHGWLMLAWFGAALATLIGVASVYSDLVERIWHPIAYLLFPLSGAAFMVDWLPPTAREYALLLPMVHGVEVLREGYFGNVVRTHYDLGYMATINLVLTFFALVLTKNAARHVEAR